MTVDPLIGARIGSYVVERRIGAGGMGAVYELRHPGIGKRLALKTLHAELSARGDVVQRFFDEARAVNVIGHPNIVDVLDFSQLEDGRFYLTMEYLEGESLAAHLRRRGPLPPAEVAAIALPICSALAAAHADGITHRDLKPENVHLKRRPDGGVDVKVLDFGIAKLSRDLAPSQRTLSGQVLGTPAYMSPEQANGRTSEVDARTDVYALGVMIYEMLSGSPPFSGESFATYILKHTYAEPTRLTEVVPPSPPAWDELVMKALAKPREARFQSMEALGAAIEAAARDAASAAAPVSAGPSRPAAATLLPIGLGLLVAAVTAGALVALTGGGEAPGRLAAGREDGGAVPGAGAGGEVVSETETGAETEAEAVSETEAGAELESEAAAVSGAGAESGAGARGGSAAPPPPDAGKDAPVAVTRPPPRGRGSLRVIAIPWAEVYVGGKKRGVTPLTMDLPAGRHRVVVENSELGERRVHRVRIRHGQEASIQERFGD